MTTELTNPPACEPARRGLTPTTQAERITSLDVLRGFALLGILLMNIVGFGLYEGAYDNPTAAGGATGANLWVWMFLSVMAEGKMRCLFSLVFGASLVLLSSRLEARGDAADLYYRRLLWMLVFGIAHAYLLWQGEILFPYAVCALAIYPFRNLNARALLISAGLCVLATGTYAIIHAQGNQEERRAGQAAIGKAERNESLTDEEKAARETWEKAIKERNPPPEKLQEDAAKWQDGFTGALKQRASLVYKWHQSSYYNVWNFDIWGMMLIGMALLKTGVLSAARSSAFYLKLTVFGYGIGVPLGLYRVSVQVSSNFDPVIQSYSHALYDLQRLAVALGHLATLMWLCRSNVLRGLTQRLGAVGQMALSNYVMHSVICAFIFTGYGFGLYGQLERIQLYYVVLGIWIFQLMVSPIWLKYRYGPLEWGWRQLTYWQKYPLAR